MFFDLIYFVVLLFLVVYLPGRFVLRSLGYSFSDGITRLTLSSAVGLSLFLIFTYILSWLGLAFLYNFFILPLVFLEGRRLALNMKLERKSLFFTLLIAIGSFGMFFLTSTSGLFTNDGLTFHASNSRDGIYHLALIGNLLHNFPPTHPELAGVELRGYHFFYDFLLASFNKMYRVDAVDLLFRLSPLVIAIFYGLAGYSFGKFIKLKDFSMALFLFLIYFAGGLEFVINNFLPKDHFYNPGINPLLSNIVNPSVLISASLLFVFYILLFQEKKSKNILLPALILGLLPQIKIYVALLTFISLGVISLLSLAKKKDTHYLRVLILASIIAAIVFLPFNLGSGGLVLAPLLLYRHFMESLSYDWGLRLQIFESHSNYPQIGLLYIKAALIFFLPTLGIRLFSLLELRNMFNRAFYTNNNIFWLVFGIAGVFLASLFIQSVDVFNIVQFLWPIYILLLVPTAVAIERLTALLFKENKWAKAVVFLGVILIALPSNIKLIDNYLNNPYSINKEKIEAAAFIKKNIPQNEGIMVINREDKQELYDLPEIAALSEHPIFYESTITSFKESEDVKNQRRDLISRVQFQIKNCVGDVDNDLLREMKKSSNHYILVTKEYPCLDSLPSLQKSAEFGESSIYKLVEK